MAVAGYLLGNKGMHCYNGNMMGKKESSKARANRPKRKNQAKKQGKQVSVSPGVGYSDHQRLWAHTYTPVGGFLMHELVCHIKGNIPLEAIKVDKPQLGVPEVLWVMRPVDNEPPEGYSGHFHISAWGGKGAHNHLYNEQNQPILH